MVNYCSNCGTGINYDYIFCSECGERLNQMNIERFKEEKYPHWVATILGYIFGFLGGWGGFVAGGYLLSRESKKAKRHGKIILGLTTIMIILWISLAFV